MLKLNINEYNILKILRTLYITLLFFQVFDENLSMVIPFGATKHY